MKGTVGSVVKILLGLCVAFALTAPVWALESGKPPEASAKEAEAPVEGKETPEQGKDIKAGGEGAPAEKAEAAALWRASLPILPSR